MFGSVDRVNVLYPLRYSTVNWDAFYVFKLQMKNSYIKIAFDLKKNQ